MNPIVKIVGGGIGLAKEYRAHKKEAKESKSQTATQLVNDEQTQEIIASDDDEYHRELDELQYNQRSENQPLDALTGSEGVHVENILTAFFERHPNSTAMGAGATASKLPFPVILPQRRPHARDRGFVRAYAPVLENCSISQDVWMDFLNGFHKAIKMSPVFNVANLAIGLTSLALTHVPIPSLAVQGTAIALQITVEVSKRAYIRYQTNKYLDVMNKDFFEPRGLYVMIMTYDPDSDAACEAVDINTSIRKAVDSRMGGNKSKFHSSSGNSSEAELPEAAPLIFPELDALPDERKDKESKNSGFLNDYFDRRAQAKFEAANPGSKLIVPRKKFASSLSDPSNPIYNTHPLTLLGNAMGRGTDSRTGSGSGRHMLRGAYLGRGRLELATRVREEYRGDERGGGIFGRGRGRNFNSDRRVSVPSSEDGRDQQERIDGGRALGFQTRSGAGGGVPGVAGMIKKKIAGKVLYLMVVNLPTAEERKLVDRILGEESY